MDVLDKLLESFDYKLMISITVLSYLTLKGLEKIVFKTSKSFKKLITFILSAILGIIYHQFGNVDINTIIPTYLISIALYDYIIKFIIKKLNIEYTK